MFNFGINRKTLLIVLLIFLGLQLISLGTGKILMTLLTLPGVLIAITFHEFAHAYTAYKLGDETPKLQGRLNLNPFSHVDIFGLMFLVVAGFGWGKPVEIDPRNFNGKYSISKAEAIVAVAGPIMNFIIAFIFLVINVILIITGALSHLAPIIAIIIDRVISINIGLGLFNLIPLPPLDGSKVLMHFLPYNGKQWFYEHEGVFYMVFVLLLITGLSSIILNPLFGIVEHGLGWLAEKLVRIFI